jgi:hypothetical protein
MVGMIINCLPNSILGFGELVIKKVNDDMLERREVLESIIEGISPKMLSGLSCIKAKAESLELPHSPRLKLKEHQGAGNPKLC